MSTFNSPQDPAGLVRIRTSHINDLDAATAAAFALLPDETRLRLGTVQYATDAGSVVNAYVVTLPQTPTAYADGMMVVLAPPNTNTGASTINVNALGVKSVVQYNGATLAAGDLFQGVPTALVYSSSTGKFHRMGSGPAGATGATGATGSVSTAPNGSYAAPAFAYTSEPGTGDLLEAAGIVGSSIQGTPYRRISVNYVCMGSNAGGSITSATGITAYGNAALQVLLSGVDNSAFGASALGNATTGARNTGIGRQALLDTTITGDNTALGYRAGFTNDGDFNTYVGGLAGYTSTAANANTVGDRNTWVGYDSGPGVVSASNLQNSTAIGYGARSLLSNQVVLGDGNVTSWAPGALGVASLGTALKSFKNLYLDYTITATVGAVTMHKACGNAIIQAGQLNVVVTNNRVTANSVVLVNQKTGNGYLMFIVIPAAGSFTIQRGSTVASDTEFRWLLVNTD